MTNLLRCLSQEFAVERDRNIKELEPCRACDDGLKQSCPHYRQPLDDYNKGENKDANRRTV